MTAVEPVPPMEPLRAVVHLDDQKAALIDQMLNIMLWLDGRTMADVLMDFQVNILKTFLATIRADTGAVHYKRGLMHVGKKNGKTLLLILASMIVLHTDTPMGRKGCQIIYVANDEDQADENLDFTKKTVSGEPDPPGRSDDQEQHHRIEEWDRLYRDRRLEKCRRLAWTEL